jgi:hypothetical protein
VVAGPLGVPVYRSKRFMKRPLAPIHDGRAAPARLEADIDRDDL